jgi:hypothetical protein
MMTVGTKEGREVPVQHLVHLLQAVTSGEGQLGDALRQLDGFAAELGGELGHFLQRRSYIKALAHLQQLEAESRG